ncbi:MAG: hypothetical protein KC550_03525 [Nanoarchaeota archaeon]|nr:hypothetical protein [Nanoarchaeota archaeon]
MKKFIVLYHAPKSAIKKMQNSSPEEMKKGMEAWMLWAKNCGKNLLDMGNPVGGGEKISKHGIQMSKSDVNGYSIIQAKDMNDAKKMLKNHPHLNWTADCEIEVFEMFPMPK